MRIFLIGVLEAGFEFLVKKRAKETQILLLLSCQNDAGMKGLDLVKAAPSLLTRSNIYIWLSVLEDDGFVEVFPSTDTSDRRYTYKITPSGEEELKKRVKSSL